MAKHWTQLTVEAKDGGFTVKQTVGVPEDSEDSAPCNCNRDVCEVGAALAGQFFTDEKEAVKKARRARMNAIVTNTPCEVCGSPNHREEIHARA